MKQFIQTLVKEFKLKKQGKHPKVDLSQLNELSDQQLIELIQKEPSLFRHLENPSLKVCEAAIKVTGWNLKFINQPKEEQMIHALMDCLGVPVLVELFYHRLPFKSEEVEAIYHRLTTVESFGDYRQIRFSLRSGAIQLEDSPYHALEQINNGCYSTKTSKPTDELSLFVNPFAYSSDSTEMSKKE